jgi:hypothetical protein
VVGLVSERLDAATRAFWRVRGRPVHLDGQHAWLVGPVADGASVADTWVPGSSAASAEPLGLVDSMDRLDGPGFAAEGLRAEVRDFYERTSCWQMAVRTRWSPWARPGGATIAHLFGRRVQQLALPLCSGGRFEQMESRVVPILGGDGVSPAAAWIRTLRSSGDVVYSGAYELSLLPGAARRCVHVVFPLPHGNLQVFLEPLVLKGGALGLRSLPGGFGHEGTYVVVREQGGDYAARVSVHETFVVFVDEADVLRTTHRIWLGKRPLVRLDYVMTPVTTPVTTPDMTSDMTSQPQREGGAPSGCRPGPDPSG